MKTLEHLLAVGFLLPQRRRSPMRWVPQPLQGAGKCTPTIARRNGSTFPMWQAKPKAKDGVGFISKVSPHGKMIKAESVKGLDAPKGLVMNGDKLYVSDVDQLVEIDVTKGQVTNSWKAEGSKFLNDTAVNSTGRVYVSDMLADSIYVLENGTLRSFFKERACCTRMVYVSKATSFSWLPGERTFSPISRPRLRAICFLSTSRQRRSLTSGAERRSAISTGSNLTERANGSPQTG